MAARTELEIVQPDTIRDRRPGVAGERGQKYKVY